MKKDISIINFFKKNYNKLIIIAYVVLIIQLLLYIFVGSKAYMNSDSAFIVDYSSEILRTGKVFPKSWINTNDFWIYSLIPFVTVFLKLGIKLFLSRQLAVLIQSILMFHFIYSICKNISDKKDRIPFYIISLLILSGITGQFMFEVFGDATYGSIIFIMIMAVDLFIKCIKSNKYIYKILMFLLISCVTMCSLRFPIYIGAPLIVCMLYLIYKDGFNKRHIVNLSIIIVSLAVGYLLYKYLANQLTIISYINKTILGSPDELNVGVSSLVYNYLTLAGTTNTGVQSLIYIFPNNVIQTASPIIVIAFIKNVFALITILLPFILIKKFKKFNLYEQLLYIFVCSLTFILIFFFIIGKMYFWYRYITPVLFFLIFLYPLVYKYIFSSKLKDKVVFTLYILLCILASLFLVVYSYCNSNLSIRKNNYQDFANYLVSKDLKFGYSNSLPEYGLFRLLSNDKVKIVRINNDYSPFEWLNSLDWYSQKYYDGEVFYVRHKIEKPISIEEESTNVYEYNDYLIFVFENNKIFTDKINNE